MALHILVTILLISSVNSLPSKLMPAKILKATPVNGNLQRLGQDRQIQPLSCFSQTTGEAGVCMFAWNCVEAGGNHLGTCIDRFYFGSCCKLPEVIASNELGPGQAPDGIVPANLDNGEAGNLSQVPIATPPDAIGNVDQPAAPVDQVTPAQEETTSKSTTSATTSAAAETSSSEDTTTPAATTTAVPTTATAETTTTSATVEETTTTAATTTAAAAAPAEPVSTPEDPTSTSGSEDGSAETTSQKTGEPSQETSGTETVSESETTPMTTTEEVTSAGSTTTSTADASSQSPEGGESPEPVKEPVVVDGESDVSDALKNPEQPADSPVTPTSSLADLIGQPEYDKPLRNMTRFEACGRRPWFSVKNHEQLYPSGVRNGASEAPIGRGAVQEVEGRTSGRRNSKFLKSWNRLRQGRIVNGQTADYGEWPWQVSLRQWRTATYLHKCGCALLSENWAITAAHCVENVSPDDLLLRMGEYDLNSMSEPHQHIDRKVQIVASHPKFDPKTFEYDLALLRFYEPVEYQPNIIPICIPEDDRTLVGETAWVTGWGRLYEDGPLPSVMQEVDLPVINNTACERMYRDAGYVEHIPNIFICAGYAAGGKDSCEGDSGGPMVVQRPDGRFMLSGVISWGIGCAEKNQPGVYTRISEFKDWIDQILQF